jgi:methionyl-tRNA formyltransferase
MSRPLGIIFLGTSTFALPILEALSRSNHAIPAVVTRPPKPAGRGKKLTQPPVADLAASLGLTLLQPPKLTQEFISEIKSLSPDLMISADYGAWLPAALLEAAPLGVLNIHPSLLPKYRGAAPIPRAILSGETVTGITFMLTDSGWDTGPIIAQFEEPIHHTDTAGTLEERLVALAAESLLTVIDDYASGLLVPVPQEGPSDYAEKLSTGETWLDWNLTAEQLQRTVRAFNPIPGARTLHKGKLLKIMEVGFSHRHLEPGAVHVSDGTLAIGCGRGALRIVLLQPEGKRVMTAEEFLRGTPMETGERLGKE